jgi:hypothetical protein
MSLVNIGPGETVLLVERSDTTEYYLTITGTKVQLGRTESEARQRGRDAPAGDRGPFGSEPGEPVYAHNPSDSQEAFAHLDHNGFWFEREARSVVGGVLTSDDNESAPASDDFVWESATNGDPSGGITESFNAPDRADFVVVSVDDADGPFDVAVKFTDADGNVITTRDSASDVLVRTAVASPYVQVEITGSATTADYSIYAR